jgi:hypothetical protein
MSGKKRGTASSRPNALLEWRGLKLLCNGAPVAVISLWYSDLKYRGHTMEGSVIGPYIDIDPVRRAINRRFRLPREAGSEVVTRAKRRQPKPAEART